MKLPVSEPSACRVSGRESDSFSRIRPLGVFIVGTMWRHDFGAAQRRDVAAVFDLLRRQPGVGGVAVLELQLLRRSAGRPASS